MYSFIEWLKKLFNKNFIPEDKGFRDEVDERNFGAEVLAGQVTKEDIPKDDFIVFDPILKDQKDSDFCTDYSLSYAREATEGVQLSPCFNFAQVKNEDGDLSWGSSPLKMCKSAVKAGIPEIEYYDYKERGKRDYYATWKNVPEEAKKNAELHKAQSYFQINPPIGWDKYDTILAYLNKFRNQKLLVLTGVDAHAVTAIGKKGNWIVCKDSYDRTNINYRIGFYNKGYRYFTRDEANQLFTGYMITDMPRNLAELLVKYNDKAVKVKDNPDVYLVKEGKKCLLKNEYYAWSYDIKLWEDVNVILKDDFDFIPTGEPLKIDGGKNWKIMMEIANYIKTKMPTFDWSKDWL